VDGADYPVDDAGVRGGLAPDVEFVIAGDLNADPNDGDSSGNPISLLLNHPRINDQNPPASRGAREAAQSGGGVNKNHTGQSRHDTADFNDEVVGNMRIDYVLPSMGLKHLGGGVFWPTADEPGHAWLDATDHHLVWLDLGFKQ
jgi:3-phytase